MFGPLQKLRETPIPDLSSLREAPKTLPPEIDDAGPPHAEPLVRAEDYGLSGKNYYAHARNPPYWHRAPGAIDALWLRRGAAERLARANAQLAAAGLALWIFDGWRPRAVQAYFFKEWTPAMILARHPELDAAEVEARVRTYWSEPTADPARPAAHETGGAVDLTLCWRDDDQQLWMGGLFDDPAPISWADHFEGRALTAMSDEEARANRRVLHWAMREAGFTPNPHEWWHFSYGDLYWAKMTRAPRALYGLAAPPEEGA